MSMSMSMKIKSIKTIYEGFFRMLEATVITSDGEEIKREIFSRESNGNVDDGVAAIVYDTNKDKYIFVKQFRVGLYKNKDKYLTEIVAGTLKAGEDPKLAMVREIHEELGYKIDTINYINEFYVSPGGSAEKIYLYFAIVSSKFSEGGGLAEEHEEIEVIEMDLDELYDFEFKDAKTLIAVNEVLFK